MRGAAVEEVCPRAWIEAALELRERPMALS